MEKKQKQLKLKQKGGSKGSHFMQGALVLGIASLIVKNNRRSIQNTSY